MSGRFDAQNNRVCVTDANLREANASVQIGGSVRGLQVHRVVDDLDRGRACEHSRRILMRGQRQGWLLTPDCGEGGLSVIQRWSGCGVMTQESGSRNRAW